MRPLRIARPLQIAGRLQIAMAAVIVIALAGAAAGLAVATGSHSSRASLVLVPGAGAAAAEPAALGRDVGGSQYRYRLAVAPADLGSHAPVARLEAPAVDQAMVRSMAATLGFAGPVTKTPDGGWQVANGSPQLTLTPTPGGWSFAFSRAGANATPGSVPGSTGAGAGSGAGASGSGAAASAAILTGPSGSAPPSGGIGVPDTTPVPPPPTLPPPLAPVAPAAGEPRGAAAAEATARALLTRLGVTGTWSATVDESGDIAVSSAGTGTPVVATPPVPATDLTVTLRPVFDAVAIDGIPWQIDVGEHGDIRSVSGTWTTLRTLNRLPLRSVTAVFQDLVNGTGIDPFPVPVSEIAPVAPGTAAPDHVIAPTTVTISDVALGFAVIPAAPDGTVLDVVPTYIFTGKTSGGDEITQTLVAVHASLATAAR